jgi:hypothetical protein
MFASSFLMLVPVAAAQTSPSPSYACHGGCVAVTFEMCFTSAFGNSGIVYIWAHGTHFAGPRVHYPYEIDETVHLGPGMWKYSYDIMGSNGYGPYVGTGTVTVASSPVTVYFC